MEQAYVKCPLSTCAVLNKIFSPFNPPSNSVFMCNGFRCLVLETCRYIAYNLFDKEG